MDSIKPDLIQVILKGNARLKYGECIDLHVARDKQSKDVSFLPSALKMASHHREYRVR